MKIFRRAVIVVGLLALGLLLWKLDVRLVLQTVRKIGPGMLLILGLEGVTLLLNAAGWRLSFERDVARTYGIGELARLWLAMDGVNYFVPTGTIAGEVARASMLRDAHPIEVRTASVVISRIAQTVAQVTFALAGFAFLVSRLQSMRRIGWIGPAATWVLVLVGVLMFGYLLFLSRWLGSRGPAAPVSGWFWAIPGLLRAYFGAHPWRFLTAVCLFGAGYLWPSVEAWWICRFIGVPVSAATAVTIEVLSVAIDGVLFLVPAKVGTQELGKTAIFSLLGLPLAAGAAFGIIRHIREIAWFLAGFGIYSADRHGRKGR